MTLLAFVAFLLGSTILGLTLHFLGPVWPMPAGFLVVGGGAAASLGVLPWLWKTMN